MIEFIIIFGLPALIVLIDFLHYLINGRRWINRIVIKITEIVSIIILPLFYLAVDEPTNDCCTGSATFSPEHRLTIYIIIILSAVSYLYCSYRRKTAPPVIEVIVNCFLITGVVLNIFIFMQVHSKNDSDTIPISLMGNIPIIMLGLMMLADNHKLLLESDRFNAHSKISKKCLKILNLAYFKKFPVLLIVCVPVLMILVAVLLLFGQKPDSIILVFTDTYKHGLSELDYMCNNVQCPEGHYLCTVAAKGHRKIVKPLRIGIRANNKIICNRQLLVANAFEELLQDKFPSFHKAVRTRYDMVGTEIHKHYYVFNNRFISDVVFFIMKPLELIFVFILYCFDKYPENRISQQYLTKEERDKINRQLNNIHSIVSTSHY